jgi:hypothetical protein
MPETLDIIREEHRRLASVITCFIGVLNDIKDHDQTPDSEADWQELDGLFTLHNDPVFGQKPKEDFNTLAAMIISQAPILHGLRV